MAVKNYYQILQVDPSAEPEVIAAAYRRLAQKYHPDKDKTPKAMRRMQEINEAYEVLSDPVRRITYDLEDLNQSSDFDSSPQEQQARRPATASKWAENLVFRSDFYQQTGRWLEESTTTYRAFRRDGNYHIAVMTPDYSRWYHPGIPMSNFRVTVEAQFAYNSDLSSDCGVIFRLQNDAAYRFAVSPSRYYALHVCSWGEWHPVLDWRYSEYLGHRDRVTTLTVRAVGSAIELGANGHALAFVEDHTLSYGLVGLLASTHWPDSFVEARFRDFRLYSVEL